MDATAHCPHGGCPSLKAAVVPGSRYVELPLLITHVDREDAVASTGRGAAAANFNRIRTSTLAAVSVLTFC